MNTNDLIERMAEGLEPVAPLPAPGRRAALWSFGAALYVGLLVLVMASVNGPASGAGRTYWLSQAAAIAAGVLASAAAFASVVPGATRQWRWWAAGAALVWLVTLGAAPLADFDWARVAAARHEWLCVGFIVLGGAPLSAAIAWMLRRGAPLSPAATAGFAALAVGTLANVGACFALPHASGAITLVWHGGVVLASIVVAVLLGGFAFSWPRARPSIPAAKREEK
jgi:hypothetical protein